MKRSTKAALLSCFVLPGAGHLYLKRFALGLLLSAGAAAAVYLIVSSTVQTAFQVAQEIQDAGVPLDVQAITELVSQRSRSSEKSTNTAMIALLALWLIGIFDSYRLGRALGKTELVAGDKETQQGA